MSPKVVKDAPQPRSNNIKNIYIQKINSLMKISKDTIEKSQIEALNHTNRKKIKKHLSEAEKNTIRLQKNRQSAKKARQRKKIYVKLLEQQEKRLTDVLLKTESVEKISSDYVQHLSNKKKQVTNRQQRPLRKSSDNNIDKVTNKNIFSIKEQSHKLQDKISLLKQIVEELTQLSKYAYWKQRKPAETTQSVNEQPNNGQEDFFNIEQVLADIEVVQMKNQDFDLNIDDLLNVPYQEEEMDEQRQKYDIKSLIADQYETVSRCLHQLQSINQEAQDLLKTSQVYRREALPPGQDLKNPQLAEFKKKNTIVPEYEIKKIKPRRIDSLNSLSSANRSIMDRTRSLFTLNNYFINMEQAETKILVIDQAIQEINRILAFDDSEPKDDKQDDFQVEKN